MAGSKTDFGEGAVLDHMFGIAAYTFPTQMYVALYTVTPGDAGGGTEVAAGEYARIPATFTRSGSTVSNSAKVTFAVPTTNWGTIVAAAVFTTLTGGTPTYWADLAANVTVNANDPPVEFAVGQLAFTED